MASGEFLFFLDDDITLRDDAIEKMVDVLQHSTFSYAYCDYSRTGGASGIYKSKPWDFYNLRKQNFISSQSLIRARDFIGWDEKVIRYTDWDLWLRMAREGKKGVYIPETLFVAYYSPDGVSLRGNNDRKYWFDYVKQKNEIC